MFKLFISYTTKDRHIAEAVQIMLNNAFQGKIETFIAKDIRPGESWKEKIKDNLASCDAIISILTEKSVERPWIFIEWSAFWMENKTTYLLITDDVKISDLVEPMKATQMCRMLDEQSVKLLFEALSEASNHSLIPYLHVTSFIQSVQIAMSHQQDEEDDFYLNNLNLLPQSDSKKKKLAQRFYDRGNYEGFGIIASTISSNVTKGYLSEMLIEEGDLANLPRITRRIKTATGLERVLNKLIEYDFVEEELWDEILHELATRSQSALSRILIRLFESNYTETNEFRLALRLQNNVEGKRTAIYLSKNNKFDHPLFETLMNKLLENSHSELKNVLLAMSDHSNAPSSLFDNYLRSLADLNPELASIVINHLCKTEPELYQYYVDENIVDNNLLKGC